MKKGDETIPVMGEANRRSEARVHVARRRPWKSKVKCCRWVEVVPLPGGESAV